MRNSNSLSIANLISNTKVKSRDLDLLTLASELTTFVEKSGGVKKAAELLTISPGMLQQFLSVNQLDESVKPLVSAKKVTSVSAAYNLTKFNSGDQYKLALLLADKTIGSAELRAISPLRKQFPNEDILTLLDKLLKSKDKKISVIKLRREPKFLPIEIAKAEFAKVIGEENLVSFIEVAGIMTIKISKKGESVLRSKAQQSKADLQSFIIQLLQFNK